MNMPSLEESILRHAPFRVREDENAPTARQRFVVECKATGPGPEFYIELCRVQYRPHAIAIAALPALIEACMFAAEEHDSETCRRALALAVASNLTAPDVDPEVFSGRKKDAGQ